MSETKKNKPFYKKWWFILIVAIFVIGTLGNLFESEESKEKRAEEERVAEEQKLAEKEQKEQEKALEEKEKAEKAEKEKQEKEKKEKEKAQKLEESKKEWSEHRQKLLDHYGESGITNIQAEESFSVFYAFVPNEMKMLNENEKLYYVEEIGPLIEEDLRIIYETDVIHVYFEYEDGSRMATRKALGGWKIKK